MKAKPSCISALDTLSKAIMNYELRIKNYKNRIRMLALLGCILYSVSCYAEVLNRVVAYVDDSAITLSEFRETFARMKMTVSAISAEEVVNSMINRRLLLKEAAKMRLEATTKDELLKDYIDIKIKASILIREKDTERFYNEHREDFKGKDYASVRDEIDKYLFEMEVNRQLKKHIEALRANAEIKVQIESSKK